MSVDNHQILVVDDNPVNTILISEILIAEGYQVKVVYDGQKALDAVATDNTIALILLDINMPKMDGFEVCQRLKSNPDTQDIPVIFMSALTDSDNIVNGLRVGGVDYIGKPFHIEEVIARVKTHIAIKMQHKQLQTQYAEIEHLQTMLRKFVSHSTWMSIQGELDTEALTNTTPMFETMTLMFTDIADFTSISESSDPREVITDLGNYMSLLSMIIHKHNGEIDKFLGDGLFAFFADAKDARAAAIEIQYELLEFNRQQISKESEHFLTRIGLASGEILQITLGFDGRLEHTLIGDRVNTAARLQNEAPVGGIIMDEASYLAGGQQDAAIQSTFSLKGKLNKEVAYVILPAYIPSLMETSTS